MSNNTGINVHFFANDKLKPKVMIDNDELKTLYPLYATLVFGQTNTKFSVVINKAPVLVSTDLSELNSDPLVGIISEYKKEIIRIVHQEASVKGFESYSVSGFGKRLKKYQEGVISFFQRQSIKSIYDTYNILDSSSRNIDAINFRDALWIIMDAKINDVTILSWNIGEGKEKIKKVLKEKYSDDDEVNHSIQLLDKYIQQKLLIESPVISVTQGRIEF